MKPASCSGCKLETLGTGYVPVDWSPSDFSGLLLVGEAAGELEARESKPFVAFGQSGSLLSDAMREMNIRRKEVAVCNVISCHPPRDWLIGAPWEWPAIGQCTTTKLSAFIEEVKPKAILALGAVAFSQLVTRPKGKYGMLDSVRGYVMAGAGAAVGIPVVGTYHPSHARRGKPELGHLIQRDLRRAFLVARGKLVEGVHYSFDPHSLNLKYQMHTTIDEAWEWYRAIDPTLPIFFDIETPRSAREDEDDRTSSADRDINLTQFTQRTGEGIAFPFRDEFRDVARAIMALPNLKVGHNNLIFDCEVMGYNGFTINGEVDDTMVMWGRFQPDLPANLQAVAGYFGFKFNWKHLADSEQEFYGICDVDALATIYYPLRAAMEREDLWIPYTRYFRRFWTILRDMAHRGLPISESDRIALGEKVESDTIEKKSEIQSLVPEEVLSQKQKMGYKNPPILKCQECGYEGRTDHECTGDSGIDMEIPSVFDETNGEIDGSRSVSYSELAEENGLVLREVTIEKEEKCRCTKKNRPACDVCAGLGIIPAGLIEKRWMSLTEFNPNSSHQVKRYIRFRKHPIPKHAKRQDIATGEASDTTEVKELERLFAKTNDPIYPKLIELRQLSKIYGTYCVGWKPERDGRLRTTFSYKPATWQTSSKAPNIQNGLKRGRSISQKARVDAFNRMQKAEDGHLLINFDAKSFHAQTTACEAGLADYLRLAKIDIHSFNACHFIKHTERFKLLKMSDGDLKGFFKELKGSKAIWTNNMTFKEIRDGKTKSAGLGIGFGMRGKKLYQMYQEDFANQKEAENIWNMIMRELFPGLLKWQEMTKHKAHEEKMLRSKFGAIRRFVDVERFNRSRQQWVGGDQAESAIAFLPAANAFGMIRDMMITLDDVGKLERFGLVNSVHDSLVFHCKKELVEECIATVLPVMEAPSPVLVYKIAPGGLSVEAEASIGENLAEMAEWK